MSELDALRNHLQRACELLTWAQYGGPDPDRDDAIGNFFEAVGWSPEAGGSPRGDVENEKIVVEVVLALEAAIKRQGKEAG